MVVWNSFSPAECLSVLWILRYMTSRFSEIIGAAHQVGLCRQSNQDAVAWGSDGDCASWCTEGNQALGAKCPRAASRPESSAEVCCNLALFRSPCDKWQIVRNNQFATLSAICRAIVFSRILSPRACIIRSFWSPTHLFSEVFNPLEQEESSWRHWESYWASFFKPLHRDSWTMLSCNMPLSLATSRHKHRKKKLACRSHTFRAYDTIELFVLRVKFVRDLGLHMGIAQRNFEIPHTHMRR